LRSLVAELGTEMCVSAQAPRRGLASRATDELDLLDWKRHVAELYAAVRGRPEPMRAWTHWCWRSTP